jgi:hypothetical protein
MTGAHWNCYPIDRYYEIHNTRTLAIPVTKLISSVMENPQKDVTKSVHWPMNALQIKPIQSPTDETQQVPVRRSSQLLLSLFGIL